MAAAALVLVASALLFAVMAFLAKAAALRLPGPEIAFVRFLLGVAACVLVAFRAPMRPANGTGLLLRGVFGGAAVLCYFASIQHLPVGLATLLNYTAPVFTAIWAALFLGEPLQARGVLALAMTVGGVALVTQGTPSSGEAAFGRWVLVGAVGAVFSGAAVAMIRLVRRTDGPWEIFGAFCVAGAVITGVPALRTWVAPTAREWGLLAAVGATSVAAQVGFTWALRYVRAAPAGVIAQLTPVATLALGHFVYRDPVSALSICGALLTLAGVTWDAWAVARTAQVVPEEP